MKTRDRRPLVDDSSISRGSRCFSTARRLLDESSVEEVLVRTRERLLEMLGACASSWQHPTFAREMVNAGLVTGVRDRYGAIGYAAVDSAEQRLVDRVASLFIADYLTRPADY